MIVNVNRTFTELRSLKGKIPKRTDFVRKCRRCQYWHLSHQTRIREGGGRL